MRYIKISFIFCLVILKSFGQNDDKSTIEKKIELLHKRTEFVSDSLSVLMKDCSVQISISKNDSISLLKLNEKLDYLWNVYDENLRAEVKNDLEFAKLYSNSIQVLKLIRSRMTRQEGMGFYDDYISVFNNFSEAIKESAEGKEMEEKLKNFGQSKVGSLAPSFNVKDINGVRLSLNDFKGKNYVLIDFWASWCAPCREELPYIKELYEMYKNKGFEIISVSKDEDLAKLKSAISKESISIWRQVAIIENDNSIEKKYFVNGIPHKVLIDKNGIIIGKWKGSGTKNKKELQQMLKSIFEN